MAVDPHAVRNTRPQSDFVSARVFEFVYSMWVKKNECRDTKSVDALASFSSAFFATPRISLTSMLSYSRFESIVAADVLQMARNYT